MHVRLQAASRRPPCRLAALPCRVDATLPCRCGIVPCVRHEKVNYAAERREVGDGAGLVVRRVVGVLWEGAGRRVDG